MCGEGQPRSKEATRRWYAKQERKMNRGNRRGGKSQFWFSGGQELEGGLDLVCYEPKHRDRGTRQRRQRAERRARNNPRKWFSSIGWRTLAGQGPAAWFRWVFRDLDQHDPDCKWRKLAYRFR